MGDSFNQTNNDQATGVQGSHNTVNVNHSGPVSPAAQVFDPAIAFATENDLTWTDVGIPGHGPEDPAALMAVFPTPAAMLESAKSESEAELSAESDLTPEAFEATKQTWFQRFKSLGPVLLKGGVVVGQAVAASYVRKSPVIAGIVAAFDFANERI